MDKNDYLQTGRKFTYSNAGFTFMELILVITIIAIMIGASIAGFSMLKQGDAKKASKSILSELAEVRTNTLSISGLWTAEIYKDGGTYKLDVNKKVGSDTELISSTPIGSRIVISYDDAINAPVEITEVNKVVISFNQGNGKVNDVKLVDRTSNAESSMMGVSSKSGDFIVTPKSSSTSNTLTLWYLTGKVTTDY